MTNEELDVLKFPVGIYQIPKVITVAHIVNWIAVLEAFPKQLKFLTKDLNSTELNYKYRPNGWTIKQVIHHIADSHHHSYIRFKWAMTEEEPIIKAYDEQAWAELHDYNQPIGISLDHISVIHQKLVYFVKGIQDIDLDRGFIHPETNSKISLKVNLGNYAWHSQHHFAHIEQALKLKFV